ncbi:hypothetical protein ABFS82_14G126800 [Erythranthe guttata]
MTIMRIINRFLLQKSPPSLSPPRWLCTVVEQSTEAAPPPPPESKKKNGLFYKVARGNSKSSVVDILNKWVNQGNDVDKLDILNLSNYLRRRKNFRAALQLYDWMESTNFGTSNADQAIRISLLCKTDGIAAAENYFNALQASDKTNKTYGALLSCYCKEKMLDKGLEIFKEMNASNYTSTLNYNNMLSLYYAVGKPEKVISLFQEMEERNIPIDLYTYNLLINSYAALKNIDAVEGVIEKMKSNDSDLDLFTYGNLATIYFKCGVHDKAVHYLEIMEKTKTKRGEDLFEAYRTRMKLYSAMNDLSGVNRAWEDLKSTFKTPNSTSYLFMLLALSKSGDQENLEKVFNEWEEGCSTFDFRLPNVLMEYYLSRDMIEKASSLYESLVERKIEPNLRTLNFFAILSLKKGGIDSAMKYLEMGLDKMNAGNSKWFPTGETIKLFLNYFEENDDPDRAEKFVQKMKKINRLDSNSTVVKSKAPDAENDDLI